MLAGSYAFKLFIAQLGYVDLKVYRLLVTCRQSCSQASEFDADLGQAGGGAKGPPDRLDGNMGRPAVFAGLLDHLAHQGKR